MPPGRYDNAINRIVLEENGRLHNPEKQCLVGSSATITDCVKVLCTIPELSGEDIVKLTLDNPLKLLGLTRKDLQDQQPNFCWDAGNRCFNRI